MPSLVTLLALKAATKESCWRLEHDDLRVRLVKVVVEHGEEEVFCAHFVLTSRCLSRAGNSLTFCLDADACFFGPHSVSHDPRAL